MKQQHNPKEKKKTQIIQKGSNLASIPISFITAMSKPTVLARFNPLPPPKRVSNFIPFYLSKLRKGVLKSFEKFIKQRQ